MGMRGHARLGVIGRLLSWPPETSGNLQELDLNIAIRPALPLYFYIALTQSIRTGGRQVSHMAERSFQNNLSLLTFLAGADPV